MPELNEEQFQSLLELMKDAIPISLRISKEEEEDALELCNKYLQDRNIDISDFSNLSIYFILTKLSTNEQIEFIKKNIVKIKENDEDIFLYNMLSPKSLAYYLSYTVIKEIYNIDKDIFHKILKGNTENLLHNFSQKDYIDFFTDFKPEIDKTNNRTFINQLHCHSRLCYEFDIEDVISINERFALQNKYNEQFNDFILKTYKSKINTFNCDELLSFTSHLFQDTKAPAKYKCFLEENHNKLKDSFTNYSPDELKEYLSNLNLASQEILISSFPSIIINKENIKNIMSQISYPILLNLYNQDKKLFENVSLFDWVETLCKTFNLNYEFQSILDSYKINEIESLFNNLPLINHYYTITHIKPLVYVEKKFRDNIQTNGFIDEINVNTSIFSNIYLKNIKELNILLRNKKINIEDNIYQKHFNVFKKYIMDNALVTTTDDNVDAEIKKLFYRIVNNSSLTVLSKIRCAEDIALINRLGNKEFESNSFSLEQILNFNVKDFKKLYSKFDNKSYFTVNDKTLILKLMFILGYNRANYLLSMGCDYPTLEHLVGNVDVRNIKLDENGNPILNKKIVNYLFDNKDNPRIKQILEDKTLLLYKYFPRIFNEWEIISLNQKDTSMNSIIQFLQSDDISLPPKYHRLEGLFKYIGCKNTIVNETLKLHEEILNRVGSSIPKVKGELNGYTYEILDLHDFSSLCIGNKTDCCFTVLGNGYSCLKHALTSENGRILVIKKDDRLVAHSWLWRNGDLLCLDNIEVDKNIKQIDFLDVYLELSNQIIKESFKHEGINNCIKNVTIGFTDFDKPIIGITNYPCLVSNSVNLSKNNFANKLGNNQIFMDTLPQPIEAVGYSDSKNVQYIINGSYNFNLFDVSSIYQDERPQIIHFKSEDKISEEKLEIINKIINGLLYTKCEINNNINKFKYVNAKDFKEVYCNKDWYILIDKKGNVDEFIFSKDSRANKEISTISIPKNNTIKHL